MSAVGVLLRAGVSWCRSAGTVLLTSGRTFSTGVCCQTRTPAVPHLKVVDRWTEKRSMFGVYDNIDILGDFKAQPKDLILAPCWLKGFRGNELERLIRKKKLVGSRMFVKDKHNLEKRIRFLYRRFNRVGKHR